MPQPIIIVEYDPRWPAMYEKERSRILGAVGEHIVALEHIGSTAVPGLGAKPIIDMLAGIRSMSDSLKCIKPLRTLDYTYHYYPEFPERCVFLEGTVGSGPHHLHMTEFNSDFWLDKLLFRDFLRVRPEVAREYDRLKRELATMYGEDRDRYEPYTVAKAAFVESVIAKARAGLPPTGVE